MTDLYDYDAFLLTLYERISQQPKLRATIIKEEVEKTECPYLKSKILEVASFAISSDHSSTSAR